MAPASPSIVPSAPKACGEGLMREGRIGVSRGGRSGLGTWFVLVSPRFTTVSVAGRMPSDGKRRRSRKPVSRRSDIRQKAARSQRWPDCRRIAVILNVLSRWAFVARVAERYRSGQFWIEAKVAQKLTPIDTGTNKEYLNMTVQTASKTKRYLATLLGLLFVVGVLLIPALHQAHCAACHDHHGSEQCPICQIAVTPVDATAPHVEPAAQILVSVPIPLPRLPIASAPMGRTAQARGPPAA